MKEDRRVQKTKKVITDALLELLEKKDFNELTVNDIAEKANVNRGTIYFHYEDKFDLLNKCLEEKLQLLEKACSPINMGASEAELKKCFVGVYQFFDDNYRFFSIMLNNGGTTRFQEKFRALILKEMRRLPASRADDKNQEFFTQFRVNALVGVAEWWIREKRPLTVDEMADNTVVIFMKNK